MNYLEVMDKICPTCPYNKNYRIGIKCTKFKEYPYLLNKCPRVIEIEECRLTKEED